MSETSDFEEPPKPEPFDREWYDKFEEVGSFQAYEYLDGDAKYRQDQRTKFETGEIDEPALDYPKLNPTDLSSREQELLNLKQTIIGHDTTGLEHSKKMEVVKQVYRWRLNEKIAEIRMLQAAENKDIRRFKRYSEFIYGRPSPDIFAYTVNRLYDEIDQYIESENVDLQQAAQDLRSVLPNDILNAKVYSLPNEETIDTAKNETLQNFGSLINVPEGSGEIDASVIKEAFQYALDNLRSDGWKVVLTPDKPSISVNQESRTVNVPTNRRMKPEELKGLVLHELGTHVARRDSGERSQLRLLGLGLDRYEGGEEGVATMREQTVGEISDFSGLEGHLAISLAYGLDGKPRTFREVHTILQKYFLFDELKKGTTTDKALELAAKYAWNRCVRTFRGTDSKTPGAAFTKDIIYREGNIAVWEIIRTNPNEMKRFNVGKYDPSNTRHLWVLTELGITDTNLEQLANTTN